MPERRSLPTAAFGIPERPAMSHPAVTVYSKSECRACDRTKTELEIRGVTYTEVNIEEDAVAYEYVTKTLGHQQAPVVVLEDDHWSGLNPGKIKEHFGPRPTSSFPRVGAHA